MAKPFLSLRFLRGVLDVIYLTGFCLGVDLGLCGPMVGRSKAYFGKKGNAVMMFPEP